VSKAVIVPEKTTASLTIKPGFEEKLTVRVKGPEPDQLVLVIAVETSALPVRARQTRSRDPP
jgi:hypothetical protein